MTTKASKSISSTQKPLTWLEQPPSWLIPFCTPAISKDGDEDTQLPPAGIHFEQAHVLPHTCMEHSINSTAFPNLAPPCPESHKSIIWWGTCRLKVLEFPTVHTYVTFIHYFIQSTLQMYMLMQDVPWVFEKLIQPSASTPEDEIHEHICWSMAQSYACKLLRHFDISVLCNVCNKTLPSSFSHLAKFAYQFCSACLKEELWADLMQ